MTVSVDRVARERIDNIKNMKSDGKKYIYESPDGGKTIYRRAVKISLGQAEETLDKNDTFSYISVCKRLDILEQKIDKLIRHIGADK